MGYIITVRATNEEHKEQILTLLRGAVSTVKVAHHVGDLIVKEEKECIGE